ncbi:MAG: anthrone oxygenase family protein [Planctomycetota bacterium]
MDDVVTIMARVGIVGVGLTGGSLFAFSTFIMAALKQLPDAEGIRAMQQINTTVFTPWFMVPFFGTAALGLGAVVLGLIHMEQPWSIGLAAAGLSYVLGVFVVTAAGNVPLNARLDRMSSDDPEAAAFWHRYLRIWMRWNHVRAATSVLSMLLFGSVLAAM